MRNVFAHIAALALLLAAGSAAASPSCLNSKPCGDKCIPYHAVCHVLHCFPGTYACHSKCIPDHVLCRIN
jgi:hypothetical protein